MTITDPTSVYRDPSASLAERVADLLQQMSLDEKLAQLGSVWIYQIADRHGLDTERAVPLLAEGIGHITRLCGASSLTATGAASTANQIQRHLVDHTRLGVPAIIHEEICSGLMARQATTFPQAIGMASTWRPELNQQLADAVRAQMRAIGTHQGLSPVLDLCRDPRWGRLEETYGEDPLLVAAMGLAFVRGLQGDDLSCGVVATAKHFVGYGASDGGLNWAPARLPERELRDVYMRPFEAAVREGGLASVMNGYHELDGVPCGASAWLMKQVLRDEWGFDGTVVSDYFAVKMLSDYHHIVDGWPESAATALTAGIDVELPSTECYSGDLKSALDRGLLAIDDIDRAVGRVLATKFRLGLFESPYVDVDRVQATTTTTEQSDLSLRAARDSLVLLVNDGVLPIAANTDRIALIGPNADDVRTLFGDYSYVTHVESLLEVLKSGNNVFAMPIEHGVDLDPVDDLDRFPTIRRALTDLMPDADIRYARGCDITDRDRSGFAEAVEAARASSVAVMVMGERSGLTDDCTTGESRDVASLDLPGVQEQLVAAIAETGTPIVLVLLAGRPIGSVAAHSAAAAVLMAWLPGECGATAVAEALVGRISPGGKLPVSYPRSSGQIPVFYGHKVSGGRSHWKGEYVDLSNEPMYPFGHGLAYSRFTIDAEPLDGPVVDTTQHIDVAVTVTNAGDVAADEVVQIYSRDVVASITRPVLELQGFHRVSLDPGESARLVFQLPVTCFGFTGHEMRYVIEPGRIELFAGTSSTALESAGWVSIAGEQPVPAIRPHHVPVSVTRSNLRAGHTD